jgi:hypothetical protein
MARPLRRGSRNSIRMKVVMKKLLFLAPVAAAFVLGGCVTVPTGPTVMVLPGPQKSLDQFNSDGMSCQQYAQNVVAPAGVAAANNAAANAAVGTVLGAAAGAIIGSATGQAGQGAAIGAGTGLLFSTPSTSSMAYASSWQMQRSYDVAYMQCMFARGNQLPGQIAPRPQPVYSYPPPNYPAPNFPPPNTPPPVGIPPQG